MYLGRGMILCRSGGMVDTRDSKFRRATCVGSSPTSGN